MLDGAVLTPDHTFMSSAGEAEDLGDRIADQMERLLPATPVRGLLAGMAKLATLRASGCLCRMDFHDPEYRKVSMNSQCGLHGELAQGEGQVA